MKLIPPPAAHVQSAIREAAVIAHREEDGRRAARWLESCWAKTAMVRPDWNDLLYYANAVLNLGLSDFISDREFVEAIRYVRLEQPLLDEPASLRAEYTRYYKPKADAAAASVPPSRPEGHATKPSAYPLLNQAIRMLQEGRGLTEALTLAQQALAQFREISDPQGEADALHFTGRIEHELGHYDNAIMLYDQALKLATANHNGAQMARSRHERARLYTDYDYDFLKAESGFRDALRYYAGIRDVANMQVAINGLGTLAQTALSYDEAYLPRLRKDLVPVGSPEAYLHIRAVVIKAEFLAHYNRYMDLLLQWAGQELTRDIPLARFIIAEGARVAGFHQDDRYINALDDLMKRLPAA